MHTEATKPNLNNRNLKVKTKPEVYKRRTYFARKASMMTKEMSSKGFPMPWSTSSDALLLEHFLSHFAKTHRIELSLTLTHLKYWSNLRQEELCKVAANFSLTLALLKRNNLVA